MYYTTDLAGFWNVYTLRFTLESCRWQIILGWEMLTGRSQRCKSGSPARWEGHRGQHNPQYYRILYTTHNTKELHKPQYCRTLNTTVSWKLHYPIRNRTLNAKVCHFSVTVEQGTRHCSRCSSVSNTTTEPQIVTANIAKALKGIMPATILSSAHDDDSSKTQCSRASRIKTSNVKRIPPVTIRYKGA